MQQRSAELDCDAIAKEQIGEILAHSPADPEDSSWPHKAVRNAIEARWSEELERGIIIERHNMRGPYTKAVYDGGTQERALGAQYCNWAKISSARWPKVAGMLKTITNDWQEQARQEDERAEQRKLQ